MTEMSAKASSPELALVDICANRLRAIQADTGVATPDQRQEYYSEELTRTLKEISPGARKQFLNSLLGRFPIAGQVANAPTVEAPIPAPATKPETLDQLFQRFLEAAVKAPEN